MPNNLRDPRYRPPKVGASEPTEVGTGGAHHGPAVGVKHHARRLEALEGVATSDILSALPRDELAARIRHALPYLADLAEGAKPKPSERSMIEAPPMIQATVHRMQWPALFEPRWGSLLETS